jgi:hypothetical protein
MRKLSAGFNSGLPFSEFVSGEVYAHKYNNKGSLGSEWAYYFHGAECRFDNLSNGQIVELIYITKPEFGFLDGYFLYNYMLTTGKFKVLANWFKDHDNVHTAIELLADEGFLTRDTSIKIQRNVIAL